MINKNEVQAVQLSPTARDFYQIWNELLETATKLSKRWDPTSTNESDPGIVLLKVLTAIADKLNYTVDKNILEAFMPSATQEEAMRKLCDMLVYNMKYYQSATTEIQISYTGEDELDANTGLTIPQFVNIKNTDEDVNYVTVEATTLYNDNPMKTVEAIEGALVEVETEDDENKVTTLNLDDNNRFYFPETQVAENGIFVTNSTDGAGTPDFSENNLWTKVDNLNTQPLNTRCYKFGYDSKKNIPYIQFPDDINAIIADGLYINYIRTSGINGNISARFLNTIEFTEDTESAENNLLVASNFSVTNTKIANNGRNQETLNDAYNNYKKTIGTFDTLVTCRDYMNKIYQMTVSTTDTTPLVSNVIVSDIRDDINRAIELCSFNEFGICYVDQSLTNAEQHTYIDKDDPSKTATVIEYVDKINHFDLILYPFHIYNNLNTAKDFLNSFKYSAENKTEIIANLDDNKAISHNIVSPDGGEIACIKIYLKLKATITTTKKVNSTEEKSILSAIKSALFNEFNMRKIDFGEELVFDSIYNCIQNADVRIKNVSLDEPIPYVKYCFCDGNEYGTHDTTSTLGRQAYNKLVLKNILAGRVPLFNYDENFEPSFAEAATVSGGTTIRPIQESIVSLESSFTPNVASGITLTENEVIRFRAPSFKTLKTYPAYINYYLHLTSGSIAAEPAIFITLQNYFNTDSKVTAYAQYCYDKNLIGASDKPLEQKTYNTFPSQTTVTNRLFKETSGILTLVSSSTFVAGSSYYHLNLKSLDCVAALNRWIKSTFTSAQVDNLTDPETELGLYRKGSYHDNPGYLTTAEGLRFARTDNYVSSADDEWNTYYVPSDLGKDASYFGIANGEEYLLKAGEYLLINYTESSSVSDQETGTIKNIVYKGGISNDPIIIRPSGFTDKLISSENYRKSHSFSKTSGFSFEGYRPAGLFSLGTSEQIELRQKIEVTLDDPLCYLYWIRNDDSNEESDIYSTFTFNESYVIDGVTVPNCAYELKDGEYLFYTDKNKTDMAFYGKGTLIVKGANTPVLKKKITSELLTAEDIITYGLAATINWVQVDLSGVDASLLVKEYQYVNLTKDDKLISLSGASSSILNKEWKPCTNASFLLSSETNTQELPKLKTNDKWEVCSLLEFNMGPTITQTLGPNDTIVARSSTQTGAGTSYSNTSLKSNYLCQTSRTSLKFEASDNFMLKPFTLATPVIGGGETGSAVPLNNFGKNWTNVDLSLKTSGQQLYTKLATYIPTNNHFGLIMFYYVDEKAGSTAAEIHTQNAYLTFAPSLTPSGTTPKLTIYNYPNLSEETWWDETLYVDSSKYYLKPGINVVRVPVSGKISIYTDKEQKSTLTISNLDLVVKDIDGGLGINERLDYYEILQTTTTINKNTTQAMIDLCAEINKIDKEHIFYYNTYIENSIAIDLNTLEKDPSEYETLEDPKAWYDANNTANKFVISELDADYLDTGITIAKTSKI